MTKTKWISVLLLASYILAGCKNSKDNDQTNKSGKLTIGVIYDIGGLGDKSFNDGVAAGIAKAQKAYNLNIMPVESRSIKDYEINYTSLAEKGVDLIVGVGVTQTSAMERVAKKFPQIKFILIDTVIDLPNVESLVFKEAEGSFLAGYLAGITSKTNKLGFVGAMKIPQNVKFYAGFAAGAKTANEQIQILPPKYTGSWSDIVSGKKAADVLYGQGADIIYAAAGRAGLGVLKAAKENKKFAIGVDSDHDYLHPGFILASMIKHVDTAIYSSLKSLVENKFIAGKKVFGIKENAIGISSMKYTKHLVGAEKLKKLEIIKGKLVENKINVPSTEEELKLYLIKISHSNRGSKVH